MRLSHARHISWNMVTIITRVRGLSKHRADRRFPWRQLKMSVLKAASQQLRGGKKPLIEAVESG